MLQGLLMIEDGDRVLPFVRCFNGSPSTYMWEDEMGVSQEIPQGEGGEQGDPLMPMLFALGQHRALVAIQERLWEGERVFAFLDDIYVVCSPERVTDIYAIIQQELFAHARISVHHGKTQDIDIITAEARIRVPGAVVWRGAQELPATRQGLKGPWGSNGAPSVCARVLEAEVRGTTSSLPAHSTRERPTGKLAVVVDVRVHPSKLLVADGVSGVDVTFAELHDRNVWQCLQTILNVRGAPAEARFVAIDIGRSGPLIVWPWSNKGTRLWQRR